MVWNKSEDYIYYKTISCKRLSNEEMEQCRTLFNNNYGFWGVGSPREGKAISFPPKNYEEYRNLDNAYVALAIVNNKIIGQAFYLKDTFGKNDTISWVLQLVVHKDYRKQGIAKTLLHSIWGFSSDYAWGLATSNALTVKTLEKATFRKVCPKEMINRISKIRMIKEMVPFAKDSEITINENQAVINTNFPVDRKTIEENRELYNDKWQLGELPTGHEWIAFTFRDQDYSISQKDYDSIFQNSEKIVNDAYNRMDLSSHGWNKHHEAEMQFIMKEIEQYGIHDVIDFGCGNGRHAIELGKRGFNVIGVDYSKRNIENANKRNDCSEKVSFVQDDCRTVKIGKKVDLALCIYDVIGSYINDKDNHMILRNIHKHLKYKGILVVSVMNLELTEHIAKYSVDVVRENPRSLIKLRASNTMQRSGEIFNPDYYLLEKSTGIVYRKEQFENDGELSAEYVVRDKRFTKVQMTKMLNDAGFDVLESRYVTAGRWNVPLEPEKGKEILFIAQKRTWF